MTDRFQRLERQIFGEDGFADAVARIEQALGMADLASSPPRGRQASDRGGSRMEQPVDRSFGGLTSVPAPAYRIAMAQCAIRAARNRAAGGSCRALHRQSRGPKVGRRIVRRRGRQLLMRRNLSSYKSQPIDWRAALFDTAAPA